METLSDFLSWAWVRHHNPLSWYIRPLFVLPFCYFAYRKNLWGMLLTIIAVASSMFWFPAPDAASARATTFLAMERDYVSSAWTSSKIALTVLIPIWFIVLAMACWQRSWLAGIVVVNAGAALKIIWSFYFAGDAAWSIVPPVAVGLVICNGILLYVYRNVSTKESSHVRRNILE
jgi:hypothetical protein